MPKPPEDYDPNQGLDFRKSLEERLAKLSLEEQREWLKRLAAKLGLEVVLVDPTKPPPDDGEPG